MAFASASGSGSLGFGAGCGQSNPFASGSSGGSGSARNPFAINSSSSEVKNPFGFGSSSSGSNHFAVRPSENNPFGIKQSGGNSFNSVASQLGANSSFGGFGSQVGAPNNSFGGFGFNIASGGLDMDTSTLDWNINTVSNPSKSHEEVKWEYYAKGKGLQSSVSSLSQPMTSTLWKTQTSPFSISAVSSQSNPLQKSTLFPSSFLSQPTPSFQPSPFQPAVFPSPNQSFPGFHWGSSPSSNPSSASPNLFPSSLAPVAPGNATPPLFLWPNQASSSTPSPAIAPVGSVPSVRVQWTIPSNPRVTSAAQSSPWLNPSSMSSIPGVTSAAPSFAWGSNPSSPSDPSSNPSSASPPSLFPSSTTLAPGSTSWTSWRPSLALTPPFPTPTPGTAAPPSFLWPNQASSSPTPSPAIAPAVAVPPSAPWSNPSSGPLNFFPSSTTPAPTFPTPTPGTAAPPSFLWPNQASSSPAPSPATAPVIPWTIPSYPASSPWLNPSSSSNPGVQSAVQPSVQSAPATSLSAPGVAQIQAPSSPPFVPFQPIAVQRSPGESPGSLTMLAPPYEPPAAVPSRPVVQKLQYGIRNMPVRDKPLSTGSYPSLSARNLHYRLPLKKENMRSRRSMSGRQPGSKLVSFFSDELKRT